MRTAILFTLLCAASIGQAQATPKPPAKAQGAIKADSQAKTKADSQTKKAPTATGGQVPTAKGQTPAAKGQTRPSAGPSLWQRLLSRLSGNRTATKTKAVGASNNPQPSAATKAAPSATKPPATTVTKPQAPSATKAPALTAGKTQAPGATKAPALTAGKSQAPSATKAEAPSATKTQAPIATKTQAPSATKTSPTATKTAVAGAAKSQAPSATKAQAPSATKTPTPSATKAAPASAKTVAGPPPQGAAAKPGKRPALTVAPEVLPPIRVPVIMREVFTYDAAGRRDPFASLLSTSELRPTVAELRLVGVLYDESGRRPVAIMRDLVTNTQYRVTTGMTLGRMRVSNIKRRSVIFTIEEFGLNRQDSLVLGDSTKVRAK